jgi:hypothetical protein
VCLLQVEQNFLKQSSFAPGSLRRVVR